MAEWGALLVMVAACLLLGWLVLALFGRPRSFGRDWLERLVAAETLGVAIVGWLALILAEGGWFGIGRLALLWLGVVTLGLGGWYQRSKRLKPLLRTGPASEDAGLLKGEMSSEEVASSDATTGVNRPFFGFVPGWVEYVVVGLWLVAAGWLFFRPHEFVIGGADAGVYVNLAASIAESGGILIDDPTLAAVDPALYPLLLRPMPPHEAAPYYLLPGFYVTGETAGQITPQFYPLHPVWQAIAYSLGGVRAALLVTGLWALLGSLAVYLVVRRLAGWPVAALALAGLSLNAIQVWFARYPTTEPLTQYLLWVGVWGVMAMVEARSVERGARSEEAGNLRAWGLLAGLALGEVFLVRIDSYFLLAIPLVLGAWLWLSGRWQRHHVWFFAPVLLLATHSFYHAWLFSQPYFLNVFGFGWRQARALWPATVLMPVLLLALALLAGRYRRRVMALALYQRPILVGCMAAVLLLAAYGWFIRPYTASAATLQGDWYGGSPIPAVNHENLVRLGWYLTPVGVWLAVAGVCLLLWRADRQTALVLGVGLFFSLLYLWRIQANPHQIYTMRRYVPAALPFFILAAAYALGWLWQQKHGWLRAAGLLLALFWLGGLVWAARGFVSQVDYRGLIEQMDRLDAQLAPDSLLLFHDPAPVGQGDFIGTPLHFLYGHQVYTVRDLAQPGSDALDDVVRGWLADGRSVYWIGDTAWLDEQGFLYEESDVTISSQALEGSYEHKPAAIVAAEWNLDLARLYLK